MSSYFSVNKEVYSVQFRVVLNYYDQLADPWKDVGNGKAHTIDTIDWATGRYTILSFMDYPPLKSGLFIALPGAYTIGTIDQVIGYDETLNVISGTTVTHQEISSNRRRLRSGLMATVPLGLFGLAMEKLRARKNKKAKYGNAL